MEVLYQDGKQIHIKIGLNDIIPLELSGHPHMTGLVPRLRERLFRTLDARGKSVGLEIAKEVTVPLCLPPCHLDFLRGERGANPVVVYTANVISDLKVHQMLGVYCSYYLTGPEHVYGSNPTSVGEEHPICLKDEGARMPSLIVGKGIVDRLTAGELIIDGLLREKSTFKITGLCKLQPVLDGPQVLESVSGEESTLLLGTTVPVPINRSPDTLRMEYLRLRNPDIKALGSKEPGTDPAKKATVHRSANRK
jgi:hypothetical protein